MREGYENLTVHGIVDIHVARAQESGPMTIKDHLVLDDCNDRPLFEALYRQIYDRLKEGGPFHEHLGPVYLLNQRRAGRQPEGFGEEPPRGFDKQKFNSSNSLVASAMQVVAEGPFAFAATVPAISKTTQVAATERSRRRQQDIVAAPLALQTEIAFTNQRIEFLERENEMLRGGGGRVSGALEAPRRGRPVAGRTEGGTIGNGNGNGNQRY